MSKAKKQKKTPKKKPLTKVQKQKNKIIEELRKSPIVQSAVAKAGTSRATYYRWRNEDRTFFLETEKALFDGSMLINDLAETKLFQLIKEGELKAIVFWLRHRNWNYAHRHLMKLERPGGEGKVDKQTKEAVQNVFELFERVARKAAPEYVASPNVDDDED